MTADAIRAGFEHLRSEQEMRPLADAARSRAESDWLVGINATRALTSFNSRSGGFQMTAAGRVQTPTLAILAGREEKIRGFKPRPYFEVHAEFGVEAGSYRGRWFDENFKKDGDEDARAERIWGRERAAEIEQKCKGKIGVVSEEKKPSTQLSPLLYDLTTLQREANNRFGLHARRTLQLAQALYEKHKVLTYPRTDSRYLPEDNLAQVRKVMSTFNDPTLARHAKKALNSDWVKPTKRVFNNAKVSDHHAIIPTGASPARLDEFERKIFDMVARRTVPTVTAGLSRPSTPPRRGRYGDTRGPGSAAWLAGSRPAMTAKESSVRESGDVKVAKALGRNNRGGVRARLPPSWPAHGLTMTG